MTEIITLSSADLVPARDAALKNQGIPAGAAVPPGVEVLYARALGLCSEVAAPAGMLGEISKPDFAVVYQGEGRNEPKTPVGDIFDRADHLALFAVTLGQQVTREIAERFRANDFALGSMLDSVASAAADRLAELAERRFLAFLSERGKSSPALRALRYSPGYCGWHISGQRRLFEFLNPGRIGISLRASFLMEPLKSVSGVIIVGQPEIHDFQNTYPFCSRCETRGCRERIQALLEK